MYDEANDKASPASASIPTPGQKARRSSEGKFDVFHDGKVNSLYRGTVTASVWTKETGVRFKVLQPVIGGLDGLDVQRPTDSCKALKPEI